MFVKRSILGPQVLLLASLACTSTPAVAQLTEVGSGQGARRTLAVVVHGMNPSHGESTDSRATPVTTPIMVSQTPRTVFSTLRTVSESDWIRQMESPTRCSE